MKKRIFATTLVLLLTLTACGSPGTGGGSDPLSAARANVDAITSLDGTMVMELDMEIAGEMMESVTTMNMSVFNDPMRLKMDMSMEIGMMGETVSVPHMTVYAEEDGAGAYTMYMHDGTSWQVQSATMAELDEYDFSGDMGGYMDSVSLFTQQGTESVDGVNAYKYTGAITGAEMEEVMRASGALESMGPTLGLDEGQMEEMLSGLGDITATMWISEADLFPVRCEMDMTGVMDSLIQKIAESYGGSEAAATMSVPKMTIVLTYSNINRATDFTIPEEARNAS